MFREFIRALLGQPHQHLINIKLENQVVHFRQLGKAAQCRGGDGALHLSGQCRDAIH